MRPIRSNRPLRHAISVAALVTVVGLPVPARSDVIVPSFALQLAHLEVGFGYPLSFFIALALAMGIEFLILLRNQTGYRPLRLAFHCFLANLYSALIGFVLIIGMITPIGILLLGFPIYLARRISSNLMLYDQVRLSRVQYFLMLSGMYLGFFFSLSISAYRNFSYFGGVHGGAPMDYQDLLFQIGLDFVSLVLALIVSVILEWDVFSKMDKEMRLSWRSIAVANLASYVVIGILMLPFEIDQLSEMYVLKSSMLVDKDMLEQNNRPDSPPDPSP